MTLDDLHKKESGLSKGRLVKTERRRLKKELNVQLSLFE